MTGVAISGGIELRSEGGLTLALDPSIGWIPSDEVAHILAVENGAAHLKQRVRAFLGLQRCTWDFIVSPPGDTGCPRIWPLPVAVISFFDNWAQRLLSSNSRGADARPVDLSREAERVACLA